jgi:uncharacterized membrane protein
MKTKGEQIKALNGDQFLIDLKKAHKVWIEAPETGYLFYISKQELRDVATHKKISYRMSAVLGNLMMRIQ